MGLAAAVDGLTSSVGAVGAALGKLADEPAAPRPKTPWGGARAVSANADSELGRGLLRPPGALAERDFLAACTRCDECVKVCPHFAIRKAGPELGEAVVGTPVIVPLESPCLMCDGLPCITVCEPGALRPPTDGFAPIGIAVVEADRCLLAQGQPCRVCEEQCPEPRAIELGFPGSLPHVRRAACTGCGVCAVACPASALEVERR